MFDIEEELKKLPDKPGVYIMHDASDSIIYVGKAVSLKRRVRQYFQNRPRSPKIARMISLIDHFEYIVVGSEVEALVLECNLIKENRPKYNTMLMDDKSYPFIKVTVGEDFPRVFMTHNFCKDKAKYYGPYTNVGAARTILELLKKIYKPRLCRQQLTAGEVCKPCLYYHVHKCNAPCMGNISKEEYGKSIAAIMDFLGGNTNGLRRELTAKMMKASENMEFEKAAEYRDLINDINKISEVQRVTATDDRNRDVIGVATLGDDAVIQVFFIRAGKMTGREHYFLHGVEKETHSTLLNDFVKQFYMNNDNIPKDILLSEQIEDAAPISEWLTSRAGSKVNIKVPERGDKEGLVKLACTNASNVLVKDSEKLLAETRKTTGALLELGELLGIEPPERIESYDISNISGYESVGSMVVHEGGKPKRSDYRKFRIRTVVGSDDYASLAEVLTRRFTHAQRNGSEGDGNDSFVHLPDLIMMDGGKGQVNVALEVFEKLGISVEVCGLVKDDNHRTRGIYYNNIEVPIDTHGELFKLITRIQDETHRFAIEYHRLLRSKEQVHSVLDDIPGIGPARRRSLMKAFESIEAVKNADIDTLARTENMNRASAEAVYNFFRQKG